MTDDQPTDPASPVPLAAPLTDEPAETDQPAPSEILPSGNAPELDLLQSDDE